MVNRCTKNQTCYSILGRTNLYPAWTFVLWWYKPIFYTCTAQLHFEQLLKNEHNLPSQHLSAFYGVFWPWKSSNTGPGHTPVWQYESLVTLSTFYASKNKIPHQIKGMACSKGSYGQYFKLLNTDIKSITSSQPFSVKTWKITDKLIAKFKHCL